MWDCSDCAMPTDSISGTGMCIACELVWLLEHDGEDVAALEAAELLAVGLL